MLITCTLYTSQYTCSSRLNEISTCTCVNITYSTCQLLLKPHSHAVCIKYTSMTQFTCSTRLLTSNCSMRVQSRVLMSANKHAIYIAGSLQVWIKLHLTCIVAGKTN